MKIKYTKPALTFEQQLNQLVSRGMNVGNAEKALHILESVSYYRLSGYWFPLLDDKKKHTFKDGASFETSFKLYCFDRELRLLITSELEKIEVAIRAKMIYILSHEYGCFWFLKTKLFRNPEKYEEFQIKKLKEEYERSDEEFINVFRENYLDELPPSWMLMEIVSFGTLSKFYSNLNPGKHKRQIAHSFGLKDTIFQNWLHSIVYLRNICAHHTRLWNRVLSIVPKTPETVRKTWINNKTISTDRLYFSLCVIRFLLQTVNPQSRFTIKLKDLLAKYPNVDITAMGFPTDWESEDLWKV